VSDAVAMNVGALEISFFESTEGMESTAFREWSVISTASIIVSLCELTQRAKPS